MRGTHVATSFLVLHATASFRIGPPLCALLLACGASDPNPNLSPLERTSQNEDAGAVDAAPPPPPVTPEGESLFLALLPDLRDACGGCHSQGTLAPLWLAPPDPYASIRAYDGIVTPNPGASKLLAKGRHSGPPLSASLRERIEAWLTEEARQLASTSPISTGPISLSRGPNVIVLSKVGNAPAGTLLTFDAQWTADTARLKLTEVTFVAPKTSGVHIVHPIFGTERGRNFTGDPVDGFSSVDQTITPGQSGILGDGLIFLEGWESGDELEIRFESLAPAP